MTDLVTVAILAKDKAHCLPLYLSCLEKQTYPKDKILLYIRTNNNTDNTQEILDDWINLHREEYKEIYYDTSDVDAPLHKYGQHEWNELRFAVLADIRQKSVEWAKEKGSHYFVVDCDNFIIPQTLDNLVSSHLPVIAPFLKTGETDTEHLSYSNYHHWVTANGYFHETDGYWHIYNQDVTGYIEVALVHCTYLIRHEVLDKVSYAPDMSGRHEYVIFAENLRKNKIRQWVDNCLSYGRITFAETAEELGKESWLDEF